MPKSLIPPALPVEQPQENSSEWKGFLGKLNTPIYLRKLDHSGEWCVYNYFECLPKWHRLHTADLEEAKNAQVDGSLIKTNDVSSFLKNL